MNSKKSAEVKDLISKIKSHSREIGMLETLVANSFRGRRPGVEANLSGRKEQLAHTEAHLLELLEIDKAAPKDTIHIPV